MIQTLQYSWNTQFTNAQIFSDSSSQTKLNETNQLHGASQITDFFLKPKAKAEILDGVQSESALLQSTAWGACALEDGRAEDEGRKGRSSRQGVRVIIREKYETFRIQNSAF